MNIRYYKTWANAIVIMNFNFFLLDISSRIRILEKNKK